MAKNNKEKAIYKLLASKWGLILTTIILLQAKVVIFSWILRSSESKYLTPNNPYSYLPVLLMQLLFPIAIVSIGFLFKTRSKGKYCVIVNLIFSLLMLFDLWYYRAYSNFISLRQILHPTLFNPLGRWLLLPAFVDILLFVDVIILIHFLKAFLKNRQIEEQSRQWIKFLVFGMGAFILIQAAHYLVDEKDVTDGKMDMFIMSWYPLQTMKNLGPIAYHSFDFSTYINADKKLSDNEMAEIDKWFEENKEDLKDNKYKGMLKGKNVIAFQWESLENFVVGAKAEGQEITPVINKLLKHSLYFNNLYEQNNKGVSSDADLLVNASLFPMRDGKYFFNYPWKQQNSLQKILRDKGYKSISTESSVGGSWNWAEAHRGSFDADILWDVKDYFNEEVIGLGLSDESFLRQTSELIGKQQQPFYTFFPTLTSHGPFNIPEEYRNLKLPKEIDENYIGGYLQSVHYTDKQLGMFIKKLEDEGLLKDTVIMMYGDHAGVNKYYPSSINELTYDGDWWKQDELRIPLIIYNPELQGETIEKTGGLVDVLPTISYLLGIDRSEFEKTSMGRVLVNTERNSTIVNSGKIKGEPKDENEVKHLEDAFKISDYIIKGDYLKHYLKEKGKN